MLENTLHRWVDTQSVDNRVEVIMRVGSLVRYSNLNINKGIVGLVIRENPIDKLRWIIHWANGEEYQEHQMHLEVICE